LSDFLLDLHRFLAHKGFAKILDISTGMPAVCANLSASRPRHISSQKSLNLGLSCIGIIFTGICNLVNYKKKFNALALKWMWNELHVFYEVFFIYP
jgi:hypothetical protein